MTQPAAEQLLNLANRAERGPLTPDEAARLRAGLTHHCTRAEQAEERIAEYRESRRRWMEAAEADRRTANEQHARAERAEAERDAATARLHELGITTANPEPSWLCPDCDGLVPISQRHIHQEAEQRARAERAEAEVDRLTAMAARYADRAIENGEHAERAEGERTTYRDAWHSARDRARKERARAVQAEAAIATFGAIFEGFGRLLATSSRDWAEYAVDAWLWAVVLGWDCEETKHDATCTHDVMEEMAKTHGWDEAAVAKARRYRAAVRAALDPQEPQP